MLISGVDILNEQLFDENESNKVVISNVWELISSAAVKNEDIV